MLSRRLLALPLTLAAMALPAAAADRGSAGLAERPFVADNRGDGTIACGAAIAHWYSVDLGTAGPGNAVRASLWADAAAGTVFLLNDRQDRLPVETLWCGIAGHSWATRTVIDLPRHVGPVTAGAAASGITIACVPEAGRLVCR